MLRNSFDAAADRRRLRKICAVLDRHPGSLPVELVITRRDASQVRLSRGAIEPAASEQLLPEIRALLGVLGDVAEVGVEAAAAGDLAAVGG